MPIWQATRVQNFGTFTIYKKTCPFNIQNRGLYNLMANAKIQLLSELTDVLSHNLVDKKYFVTLERSLRPERTQQSSFFHITIQTGQES